MPDLPHGRTARRLEWRFLPPDVRTLIESRCGSEVVGAESQTSGFTPGFASVLICADGSRHFVKAASTKAQAPFAESYREEARKLAALPDDVAAPRLLWSEDGDWVVLGIEHVDAQPPRRPWTSADLERALDACERTAAALTPPPPGEWVSFAHDFADAPALWSVVAERRPDLDGGRLREASALAAGFADATAGETLVHNDVRDDNVLLGVDGRTWICDWNWPSVGAAWIDTVSLLIGPRADGVDVEQILAERALTRDVPAEHIDTLLALFGGFWLKSATDWSPPSSPYIRDAQRIFGDTAWSWLAERRGWA